ncbi:MAG: MarR family transcriptional regulator [Odoribacter sp.]|nr:MarR family transcriptional regulator [Odoribacter sp.]
MEKYELDKFVNHRIATVATLLKRMAFRLIHTNDINITPEQWVVLYYLWEKDGLMIGELVERTQKDFGNITRIVDKLVKSEYIEKRKDKEDNRKSHVWLLEKGRNIKNDVLKCWKEGLTISMKSIDKKEEETLLRLLFKIESNILYYLKKED